MGLGLMQCLYARVWGLQQITPIYIAWQYILLGYFFMHWKIIITTNILQMPCK
jgi:hypothetical protein